MDTVDALQIISSTHILYNTKSDVARIKLRTSKEQPKKMLQNIFAVIYVYGKISSNLPVTVNEKQLCYHQWKQKKIQFLLN